MTLKTGVMTAENSYLHHWSKLHFKIIILKWNNNSQYYYFTVFHHINAALVSIRDFFQKH